MSRNTREMSVSSVEEIKNSMLRLLVDRSDADLTIVCGGSTQIVHSFVLWPRSPYFHTMCKGKFMEAASMRIDFKEEDPFLIDRMLRYCYMLSWSEFEVQELGKSEDRWVSRLDTIVRMYALGDKFDLKGLKQEARGRFVARLDEPSSDFIQPPKTSPPKPLSGRWPITEFIAVIPLIYTTTPDMDRGLRDLATEFGRERWKTIWAQPEFKNGLTEIGDFIDDVFPIPSSGRVYVSGVPTEHQKYPRRNSV